MFLRNLIKLRPESSILLAAAMVVGAAAACEPSSGSGNDGPIQVSPTGGVSGTAGGTMTGGMTGGTTGSTPGGMPGTTSGGVTGSTPGGMPGTTSGGMTGSTPGGMTGSTAGGDAGVDAGSPGGTTGGGAWMPVVPSKVKGTGGSCLSVGTPTGGKCGSYYCGVDMATLSPEINPAKPCGMSSDGKTGMDVWAYACEASLAKTVTDCAVNNALASDPKTATRDCVKKDSVVIAKKVTDACIDCFGAIAECCKNNDNCFTTCLISGGTKSCDDAQKAAGCVAPLWACSGLPDPL